MKANKKGQNMNFLVAAVIGLIVLSVAVGFGANMFTDQETDYACEDGYTRNFSLTYPDQCCLDDSPCNGVNVTELGEAAQTYHEATDAMGNFSGKFALIASVIVMVFIIGLLFFLRGRT